jgi:hypothetical protein
MTAFRRTTTSPTGPDEGVFRVGRFVGRVLLWGCVLLLLVRGIASYLNNTTPTIANHGVPVTVTQPAAGTGASQAQGR